MVSRRAGRSHPVWMIQVIVVRAVVPFGPLADTVVTFVFVQSIGIDYPDRPSWNSGTDSWIIYWFVASMVVALCFRPFMNVTVSPRFSIVTMLTTMRPPGLSRSSQ